MEACMRWVFYRQGTTSHMCSLDIWPMARVSRSAGHFSGQDDAGPLMLAPRAAKIADRNLWKSLRLSRGVPRATQDCQQKHQARPKTSEIDAKEPKAPQNSLQIHFPIRVWANFPTRPRTPHRCSHEQPKMSREAPGAEWTAKISPQISATPLHGPEEQPVSASIALKSDPRLLHSCFHGGPSGCPRPLTKATRTAQDRKQGPQSGPSPSHPTLSPRCSTKTKHAACQLVFVNSEAFAQRYVHLPYRFTAIGQL